MAFTLGSLFIDLKVNTAQFLDGFSKASAYSQKFGRDVEHGLGKVSSLLAPLGELGEKLGGILDGVGGAAERAFSSVGKMGGALGVLTAGVGGATALGGAMFALADHAAEVGSKIYEASEKTGIGAEQMSGLMAIAKETGGNFDALTTALARAGANLEKAIIEPGGQSAKILSQVMGGAKQLTDLGLKPMGDRVQQVMARIFAMNDVGARNAALSSLLGRGWMENVSALKILAEQGYGPAIEQAKKFGVFFDDNAAKQARQFQLAIATVKAEVSALGLAVGQSAVPAFSKLMQLIQGVGSRTEGFVHAMAAVGLAIGGNFAAAAEQYRKSEKANADADQAQTDFLVHLQNLTAGEKASEDGTRKLTGAVKEHRDVLAELIEREKDELTSLDTLGSKQREAQLEYQRTMREIERATAAGGNYAESLQAQALALDVYKKKLSEIPAILPKNLPGLPGVPASGPELQNPGIALPGVASPGLVLSQLATLPGHLDSTRGAERALRGETELSDSAFRKLAQAFPNLTEAQVAATAAGRKMIEQLSQMDKAGATLAEHFAELKNKLITDGSDIGGAMVNLVGGAIGQLEDAFAKLAVTGKGSFRQIRQGIEESLVKAGLQKGVSEVLGHIPGLGGSGSKPDGTASNPLHVVMAERNPMGIGATAGKGALGTPPFAGGGDQDSDNGGPMAGISKELSGVFGSLESSMGKLLGSLGSVMKGLGSSIGSLFGGFLAGGGDVTPGKAYVVGERHPEWFMPGRSGQIVPSLSVNQLRPLHYSPVFNINTPNADSFRRSHGQIVSDGYRTMAMMHSRNS